jgi:hypothetical protein
MVEVTISFKKLTGPGLNVKWAATSSGSAASVPSKTTVSSLMTRGLFRPFFSYREKVSWSPPYFALPR